MSTSQSGPAAALARVVGVPGAVLLGLGSILGTGVFVSIGIAAEVAGSAVVLAVALAAGVAACNALSSAQLAARHPVSGGAYEYGYRELTPALGFTAGWMFLCAKSASAATAALGLAGYVLTALGAPAGPAARSVAAVVVVVALTVLVAGGMARSNRVNAAIVVATLLALGVFVVAALPAASANADETLTPLVGAGRELLGATALMFVAYTGYGRIATLGEEVSDPARTIPRAIVATLLVSMLVYVAVAAVAVGAVGAPALAESTRTSGAPLEDAARALGLDATAWIVALGAVTALVSVLLNLLLGLSRVLLAMARRGDVPRALAVVHAERASPRAAVFATGALVAVLAATGSIESNWSFSAFTVLVYYALTNLAALRLGPQHRLYPRWVAALGLASCLGLAFWVEWSVVAAGVGLIALGLVWHAVARRRAGRGG